MTTTHTYDLLAVSQSAYDEVRRRLLAAGPTVAANHARLIAEREPALDMHGLALLPVKEESLTSPVKEEPQPLRVLLRQVTNQLYIWRVNPIGSVKIGEWVELATFDKSSEAAYVGAIVERAVRIALTWP